MWMLNLIPDGYLSIVVHSVLIVSILGAIAGWWMSFLPPFKLYSPFVQYGSLAVLIIAIYFEGALQPEKEYRERIAALEKSIKKAEEKSQQVNTVIETKIVEKIKKVKDVQVQVVEKIVEVEKTIDAKCDLDPAVISILNEAAKGPTE